MVLVGPFQLRAFCDSMMINITIKKNNCIGKFTSVRRVMLVIVTKIFCHIIGAGRLEVEIQPPVPPVMGQIRLVTDPDAGIGG